ncbi:hypothetical protein ACV13_001105 [Salmonella enterica subsp. enterica]|uniref:Uncharacterized protein n=2 Tax=Salmonella enterica TaxID=28901 RepID=A0A745F7V5_SALER|nr:hypothetical protein [Salmonella enterica subsp. enterica serovar Cerro]EDR8504742.1 hypothetical protein [Salmonella enterica]ELP2123744.1 hypothetical protein [Salmonella enterica subsp. enterica serovar Chailey]EDQ8426345.1 hypothetical protein [Salmonella enterica subsp. enterica serovar Cerro]EDQ9795711.1 hypothetical protein [Salmonella enterica subsp. enterica serovar Cerro]
MNVACDGPSGRGPWMGRVIRSQHISNLKYEGYKQGRGLLLPCSLIMQMPQRAAPDFS